MTPFMARASKKRAATITTTGIKAVAATTTRVLNRKRKPDNTVTAIQRPAKDNTKKTSGGFKDVLKEKCPWHLEGNHTTEQCYQLRRAFKDTPEPRHPHDKKGKKKADEGNDDFQEPDKTVNVLFDGLPTKRP
jgi:hypothetical protein